MQPITSASVAAIGVAAHECGHAIQHAKGYAPLQIRGALVPVANFGSMAAWPLIIIGLFMNGNTASLLINLGILLFSAAVLFQIVTLPVEFNASSRAIRILEHPECISGRIKSDKGSAAGGSDDVCGKCRIYDSAAASSVDHKRRKKR